MLQSFAQNALIVISAMGFVALCMGAITLLFCKLIRANVLSFRRMKHHVKELIHRLQD